MFCFSLTLLKFYGLCCDFFFQLALANANMSLSCTMNFTSQKQHDVYFQLWDTCFPRLFIRERMTFTLVYPLGINSLNLIQPQLFRSIQAVFFAQSSQSWSCALWILSLCQCHRVGPRLRPCLNLWDWILSLLRLHPTLSALSLVSHSQSLTRSFSFHVICILSQGRRPRFPRQGQPFLVSC